MRLEVVTIGENGVTEEDLLIYDETNGPLAYMISRLRFPVPLGVFKRTELDTYDHGVDEQIRHARETKGEGSVMSLIEGGEVWEVKA